MQSQIFEFLRPVRRRRQLLFAMRAAAMGLLASAAAGAALGLARWLLAWPVSLESAALVLAAGPVLGLLVGLVWQGGWRGAASAVDRHYALKDRAATALEFLQKPSRTPLHELQLADAAGRLSEIVPAQVVPLAPPRLLLWGMAALVVAVALLTWPSGPQPVQAGPAEPLPGVLAIAEQIEEDLQQFEELAKQEPNEELEQLLKELKEKVEELKEPGVDSREALAKLSEMQAAMQAQQAQFNTAAVDAGLQSLGEALSVSQAFEAAGKALVEGDFDKAVQELEQIEEPPADRKEAKALEEKLKKVAQELGEGGLGSLSESASEIAEGAKGEKSRLKQGTRQLAKEVSKHERRKKINMLLQSACDGLSECKCQCEADSLAKFNKPQKSLSPSQSFGMGTSGNVAGDPTSLQANRKLEQITGQQGDGPAEVEVTHSPEGRQQAARSYREMYQKYQRMSEAVLDSEPIPLGHRQAIRRYFELIRPDQADLQTAAPAADAQP